MSNLGKTIYSVLLVWMRAVNDWIWSLVNGGGEGLYKLVLAHWKTWLIVLVVTGMVVDWLVWMVRWRPLRLIFGKRVNVPEPQDEADWEDEDEPYYRPDDDADLDSAMAHADWTDTTLRTLSEIDPDWADNLSLDAPEVLDYAPPEPPRRTVDDPWAETPDEYFYDVDDGETEPAPQPYAPPAQPESDTEPEPQWQQPSPDLYAAEGDDEAMEGGTRVFGRAGAPVRRREPAQYDTPDFAPDEPVQNDDNAYVEPDEAADYAAPPTRRRRRGIRASGWNDEDAPVSARRVTNDDASSARRAADSDARPARLVTPEQSAPQPYAQQPKRKRFLSLSADGEEAVSGLPPMPTDGDAFYNAAMPDGSRRDER